MRIQENPQTVSFTIFDADTLDPITVFLQDFGGGCGRLIVECWCTAWAAYWGAMGSANVREFVLDAHADYIVNRMRPQDRKHLKRDEAYLLRIVKVVQQALREGASAAGLSASAGQTFPGIPASSALDSGATTVSPAGEASGPDEQPSSGESR